MLADLAVMGPPVPDREGQRGLGVAPRLDAEARERAHRRAPAIGADHQGRGQLAAVVEDHVHAIGAALEPRDARGRDDLDAGPALGQQQQEPAQAAVLDAVAEGMPADLEGIVGELRAARPIDHPDAPDRLGDRGERGPQAERVEHPLRAVHQGERPAIEGRVPHACERLGLDQRHRQPGPLERECQQQARMPAAHDQGSCSCLFHQAIGLQTPFGRQARRRPRLCPVPRRTPSGSGPPELPGQPSAGQVAMAPGQGPVPGAVEPAAAQGAAPAAARASSADGRLSRGSTLRCCSELFSFSSARCSIWRTRSLLIPRPHAELLERARRLRAGAARG